MNVLTVLILIFFLLGALDKLLGNRFGLGPEFEKGFALFAPMALSMLGMLVVAPAFGVWLTPVFEGFYEIFHIDPSILPASVFANDMGGATLSVAVGRIPGVGEFNAYVVASMMGTTVSYTIPVALGLVKREWHGDMFFGFLCGIVTVPLGCFVGGLMCGIGIGTLLLTLLPVILFSSVVILALLFIPNLAVKIFTLFGHLIRWVSMAGLLCAVFTLLTGIEICEHFDTFENGAFVCANACVTLAGALVMMHVLSKLLHKPIQRIGRRMGLDSTSALGLLTSVVSSTPTFGVMNGMNRKGVVLNSAFAVSAAFAVGGHLAFTMAYDPAYVPPMLVGKLISGVAGFCVALLLYRKKAPTSNT